MTTSQLENLEVKLGEIRALTQAQTHYCPGCEHGVLTRLIGHVIDKLGIREKTVMVDSIGCSVLAYNYFNCDHIVAPHGRAPAIAAGLKRVHPELVVFTIQGDGDGLAIGLLETLYSAIRGEPITVFLVNNGIYGMTGGQMAPTTLPEAVTTTTPLGRDTTLTGNPIDIMKFLSAIPKATYARRVSLAVDEIESPRGSVYTIKSILEAKQVVENAFKVQQKGGYAFIEMLSSCSINWKMPILDAKRYVTRKMTAQYPLGVYRDDFGIEKR
jgi:2-oxoglutarate ferredoxin oxidoreductase subunit beta